MVCRGLLEGSADGSNLPVASPRSAPVDNSIFLQMERCLNERGRGPSGPLRGEVLVRGT